jgi:MFS family permease
MQLMSCDTASLRAARRFTRRQALVLTVLLGAAFMLSIDFSILNVALPQAGAGVGMTEDQLPWIATAFALPAAGCTLLCGRLGDRFGARRVFLAAMVVLAAGSLLGGLATGPAILLAARALQGLAAAMAVPTALALITTSFGDGPLRERALGLNGALACGGFTVGALAGGTLVDGLGWRAAFIVNVPLAVAVLVVAPFVVSESRRPERTRLDLAGAVTGTVGLVALVYAVIEADPVAAVVGVGVLAAFWRIERRAPAPLVPITILTRPGVVRGNLAGMAIFLVEPALIFLTTLYLQHVLGLSPLATGLVFGVPGVAAMIAGVVAGRAIGRVGVGRVLVVAMSVQALAIVPLLALGTDRSALFVLVPALFVGFFGHVAAIVAATVAATSDLPDHEQGLAAGLASTTQQVAITVGIPALSAIAALAADPVDGYRLALAVAVVAMLAVVAHLGRGLRATRTTTAAAATRPTRESRR